MSERGVPGSPGCTAPEPSLLGLSIPLYNEAALVEAVVAEIIAALESAGLPFRHALVDNGSADGTGEIVDRLAADARIRAVHLRPNQGYGGGILAGLRALDDAEVLGWTWGDGQVDPAVIPGLYALCVEGAMLARARRVARQDGWRRRVLTRIYAAAMRLNGVAAEDPNGCPKLLRREAWQALSPRHSDWFLDAEVVMGAEARGWRIADLPVTMRPRRAGASKVRPATIVEFAKNLAIWKLTRAGPV